jgi:cupin 2 domain-containing protein
MLPAITRLFPAPRGTVAEEVTALLQTPSFRLEHIVSYGQASRPGFWYDQSEDEWVVLLRGTAVLDFGEDGSLNLAAGDSLKIPAHRKHRVEDVSEDAVWVALHFKTTP